MNKPLSLFRGCEVTFEIGAGIDGRRAAIAVCVASQAVAQVVLGQQCFGTLKILNATYGFIFGSDGRDYFFHTRGLAAGEKWRDLEEGMNLAFISGVAERGLVAEEVRTCGDGESATGSNEP